MDPFTRNHTIELSRSGFGGLGFIGCRGSSGLDSAFSRGPLQNLYYILHRSSFRGLPSRILNMNLVKPKQGTTMETIGKPEATKAREATQNTAPV